MQMARSMGMAVGLGHSWPRGSRGHAKVSPWQRRLGQPAVLTGSSSCHRVRGTGAHQKAMFHITPKAAGFSCLSVE